MSDIKIFENEEFGQIRTLTDEQGEPWFVASDIAKTLGYRDAANMTRRLDEDEKGTRSVSTPGGEQRLTCVNEPGLYTAILGSKLQEAKAFKRWVTHEVLPAIRRDGGYMVAPENEPPEVTMARALKIADEAIKRKDARIAEMRPKEVFADAVSASNQTILIGDLAKLLKQNGYDIGQKRLFAWLRDNGYLMKSGASVNMPTQRAMDMGLFRVKETAVTHSDGHVTLSKTTKVTGKGQEYFTNLFLGEGPLCEA